MIMQRRMERVRFSYMRSIILWGAARNARTQSSNSRTSPNMQGELHVRVSVYDNSQTHDTLFS